MPATKSNTDELDQVAERTIDASLGNAHQHRDDLAQAESSLLVHLELYDLLGRKEDVAVAYSNLGNLYQTLGDLAQAEAMYQESMALFEELEAASQVQHLQKLRHELTLARGTFLGRQV